MPFILSRLKGARSKNHLLPQPLVHYATYEAAVLGFGSGSAELGRIRRALAKVRPKPSPIGSLKVNFGALGVKKDPRTEGWIIRYFFAGSTHPDQILSVEVGSLRRRCRSIRRPALPISRHARWRCCTSARPLRSLSCDPVDLVPHFAGILLHDLSVPDR